MDKNIYISVMRENLEALKKTTDNQEKTSNQNTQKTKNSPQGYFENRVRSAHFLVTLANGNPYIILDGWHS